MCKYADLRRTTKEISRMNEMTNSIPINTGKCYTCMSNYMNEKVEPGESEYMGQNVLKYGVTNINHLDIFQIGNHRITRARTHTSVSVYMIHPCASLRSVRMSSIEQTPPQSNPRNLREA